MTGAKQRNNIELVLLPRVTASSHIDIHFLKIILNRAVNKFYIKHVLLNSTKFIGSDDEPRHNTWWELGRDNAYNL